MKLLFLSNLFPDSREPYRGLDNATLLHSLAKDCEIRAIGVRPALPFRKIPTRQPREIDARFQPRFVETFYVPKLGSYFNHHLVAAAIRKPLLALKKEFPFDLVLVAWTFPDTVAVAKLQSEFKAPFVSIVQGSDAHVYLKIPARKKTIVRALNQSSGAITRSAKLAELLAGAGVSRDKLRPVYNGVDLETFHPVNDKKSVRQELGLTPDLPMLLFVGNFLPVKNPQLLVRAHAKICKRIPCQLVMVGGGPLGNEVRKLADDLGFGKNVLLAGRKLAPQVARFMQAADMLCLSSENEGVPNVVLEAFASGIPVVSTDVGGISEVLNADFLGRLVERGNCRELSEAISDFLTQPSPAEKIRNHALHFSWERAAEQYLELLKRSLR